MTIRKAAKRYCGGTKVKYIGEPIHRIDGNINTGDVGTVVSVSVYGVHINDFHRVEAMDETVCLISGKFSNLPAEYIWVDFENIGILRFDIDMSIPGELIRSF